MPRRCASRSASGMMTVRTYGGPAPRRGGSRMSFRRRVPLDHPLLRVHGDDAIKGRFQQGGVDGLALTQGALGCRALGEAAPQFQLRHHLPRQGLQGVLLRRRQCARHLVNDTEGAEGVAVGGDQGGAGVEADGEVARDQGVVGEARVGGGVRDEEDVGLEQGVGAEGHVARGLAGVQPDLRLEPLTVLGDQADDGHGDAADLGGQAGEIIERRFRGGVEDVIPAQGFQAGIFIVRQWSNQFRVFPSSYSTSGTKYLHSVIGKHSAFLQIVFLA